MPRIHLLTERRTTDCRLAPADVEYLAAHHRAHLRVEAAGPRGRYRVTPSGHVGTISGPACRVVIRPKIPVRNLFHLLDPADPFPAVEDRVHAFRGGEALDFLAARLVALLGERAAAGLHRGYAERAEAGPFLHGRLDVPAQLRQPGVRKDHLHCRFDEFTADVPCNQLPRATAELVLRSPLLGHDTRARLRQALAAFADVGPIDLRTDHFAAAAADPLVAAYRPLLDLCRLLAEGLSQAGPAGTVPFPAFLIDMDRVFETYVTRGVCEAFAAQDGFTVSAQARFRADAPGAGLDIPMRPDVLVENDGRPALVLDAKWKRKGGRPWTAEDLYQLLAYALAAGTGRAVLIYPGRKDRAWRCKLARTPTQVEVRTLRVVGNRDECARSLARLGRALLPA